MRPISPRVRKVIDSNPEYKFCMLKAYKPHICGGRITMEHTIIYAGRQLDEAWAIISCCAKGQEVDSYQDAHTMDKNLNKWVAINRATDEELLAVSKVINYQRERANLNHRYGQYVPPKLPVNLINYPANNMQKTFLAIMIAAVVMVPSFARAQTINIEETLVQLTNQLIQLVTLLDKQLDISDTKIAALEARVAVLESGNQKLGAFPSSNTLSADQQARDADAVSNLIQSFNSPQEYCKLSTLNSPKPSIEETSWTSRRANDRIFNLMCIKLGF